MVTTVAVLGTGTMGEPMARNLLRAGFTVQAWNRTPEKAAGLAEAGVLIAPEPTDAVRGADAVITMLYDADAVEATMRQAGPGFARGTLWLQMSTIGPAAIAALEPLAAELGAVLVDAPVLGTRGPAEAGKLTVLANGPAEVREKCAPVFDAVAGRTLWVDGPQAAQRLKLVVNSWVLTLTEGVAEALVFAGGLGLDPALFLAAIDGSPSDTPYAQMKGKAMLAGDLAPSFAVDNALKDARLILEAAAEAGVHLDASRAAYEHLAAASAEHGGDDMSALYLALT